MPSIKEAILIGGFTEDYDFMDPLARELCEGEYAVVDSIYTMTLAYALDHPDEVAAATRNKIAVGHSAGTQAIKAALVAVSLNGAEPTPLHRTINGARKVALNPLIGREEGVPKPGVFNAAIELFNNPRTIRTPFDVRTFSTLDMFIAGGKTAYPEGRIYLPTAHDEFGFGNMELIRKARANGIFAEMLMGYHCQPMLHPKWAAQQIKTKLEQL